MVKKIIRNMLILLVVMGMILSCAAKTSTIIWKDKEYKNGIIDSVLIIGVTKKTENRSLFENALSEAFKSKGVTAHVSVDVFGPDEKLTKDIIKQKALDLGVKAVILTHLVSMTEEDVYRPASTVTSRDVNANHIGSYFNHVDSMVHYPGSYEKHKVVRLKTSLFETASEKLIFTISSKTMDSKSVDDIIHSVCKAFMKDLKKNGLL
ncbi:MAG: hypothetical protein JRI91_15390 [Deltaproteobacteria bacterium]|nr:hypothetical protein [Deltaproteobacteria bacterium]